MKKLLQLLHNTHTSIIKSTSNVTFQPYEQETKTSIYVL